MSALLHRMGMTATIIIRKPFFTWHSGVEAGLVLLTIISFSNISIEIFAWLSALRHFAMFFHEIFTLIIALGIVYWMRYKVSTIKQDMNVAVEYKLPEVFKTEQDYSLHSEMSPEEAKRELRGSREAINDDIHREISHNINLQYDKTTVEQIRSSRPDETTSNASGASIDSGSRGNDTCVVEASHERALKWKARLNEVIKASGTPEYKDLYMSYETLRLIEMIGAGQAE